MPLYGSVGSAQLGRALLFGLFGIGFARSLQAALHGCALGKCFRGGIEMRGLLIGHAKQIIVHRVRVGVRVSFHGLLQLRNRFLEPAAPQIYKAQTSVRHDQRVIFGAQKSLVAEILGFRQRGNNFDRPLGVFFGLLQLLCSIGSFRVIGSSECLRHNRQDRRVIRIQLDFFFSGVQQFGHLLRREIPRDKNLIDRGTIAALRIFLHELLRQLCLLRGFRGLLHFLVSRFFFGRRRGRSGVIHLQRRRIRLLLFVIGLLLRLLLRRLLLRRLTLAA